MTAHDLWHVVVLVTTLLGAGGLVVVALAPLLFDAQPRGLVRARPIVLALTLLATLVLLAEWLLIH